ncbi:MAG: SDR family oxidoreductase [Pseudomonadota bacterium]
MIALITGASRGLGYAVSAALAHTHHVIAVARTTGALEDLDDVIQAQGGAATLVPLDLNDSDGVSRMCAAIYERWGGVDLWVHTAAQAAPLSPAHHIAPKDFAKSLSLHATVTSDLITKIDPLLRPKKGTAVYMSDDHVGAKFFGTYAAAKSAEGALFSTWAKETEKQDIEIVSFAPQPMPTSTRARFYPGENRSSLASPADEAQRLLDVLKIKVAAQA